MNNDLISREALKKHKVYSLERHEYVVPVYNIDNAPTVVNEKLTSERPQGEMTNKEAIEHLRELKTLRIEFLNVLQEQALDMAIKALDIYKTFCPVEFPTEDDPYPVCSYTRPIGEWKHIGGDEWCCSECGRVITTEGSWENPISIGEYHCPNCGAKMRKGGDEE